MTFVEFRNRLPKPVQEKTSEHVAKVWFCIFLHVVEQGQTSRYDEDLRERIREFTGEWISDSSLKSCLKRMSDAGLLQNHRIICRYTEVGRAMLPLFGTFIANDGPPAGAHMVYTLPGMVPRFERKDDRSRDPKDTEPSAAPNDSPVVPSGESETNEGSKS